MFSTLNADQPQMHRLIEQSLIPDKQTVVAFGQESPDLQTDKQTDAAKCIFIPFFCFG